MPQADSSPAQETTTTTHPSDEQTIERERASGCAQDDRVTIAR